MQTRKRKSLESEDATKPPEIEQSKKRKNTPAEADTEAKAEKERGKTRDHSKTKSSAPSQSEAVNKQTDKQVQAPPRPAPRTRSAPPPTSYPAQPPPAVPSSAAEMASGNNGEDPFSSHSALHGLLRKLGAGFEDLVPGMMGGGSSQIKAIMTGLKQVDDEGQQLVSLTELCDVLSVAGEESMGSFPFEALVPLLVQLLNMEHNPDIMLLAARALTFMADSMPSTCSVISRHGAVPALCGRLLTIEYIDLAEQSLQALEKISHDYPHVLLQHGGLLAVLSYLDFFPTSVQRVAAKTAANICRGISTSHSEAVFAAVPILTSLLQYQDSKVVDSACLALSYIVTAFAGQPTLMSQLTSEDLLTRTLQLLSISDTGSMNSQITTGTYFSLIKLLSTFINGCPAKAARILLLANDPEGGAIEIVRKLLSTSSMLSSSAATSSSVVRSSDQLQAVVQLAADTLPAAPDAPSAVLSGLPLTSTPTATPSEHEKVLKETPHLLDKFSSQIMPFLLQVYSTSAMSQVRQTCLVAICRILFASSPAMLQQGLKEIPISSFIGGLISSKDSNTAAYAMQLAEILMLKLPSIFSPYFLKEGVVHAIDQLAAKATKATPPSAPAATEKTSIRSSTRITKKATEKETSPPKPAPAPTPPTMKEALAARASQFQSLYFASGSSGGETQGLILLRSLSEGLPTQADSKGLSSLLSALGGSETSVFELLSSGAMHHLLSFLTGQDLMGGEGKGDQVLLRLERLMEAAGDMTAHSSSHPGHSAPQAVMTAVVRKLQAALSSLESFPIAFTSQRAPAQDAGGSRGLPPGLSGLMSGCYGRGGGGGGGGSGSGLAFLAQPFKLRLARHPSEKQLRDYGANVVMIEPLASFGAIEDFLYTRVYRTGTSPEKPLEASKAEEGKGGPSDPPAPAPGSGSRRKSKEAARGEDKTAARPIPDEASRAAGRRVTRSRSAKEKEVPPEDEDDDFDMLDDEEGDEEGEGVPQGDSDDANHYPAGEMEVDEEREPIVGEEEDEEEHYMDEEEDDDGEGGGEEEEIARPMPVHDLHVASEGDLVSAMAAAAAVATEAAAKGSIAQAGFAGPSPAAAPRTTAPVAAPAPPPAAAAASEPPASARDAVAQGAKARLVFYLDGRKLTSGTSIFQAVQQQATQSAALRPQEAARDDDEDDEGAQGTAASIGRLWEAVHTIHYRLLSDVEAEEARSEKEAPPSVSPQQPSLGAGGKMLTSPLAELLLDPLAAEGGSSLATLSTSQPCKEVLALLQIFEAVSRLGHRVTLTLHPSAGSSVTPTKALGDKTSAKEPSVPPSAALALSTAVSREEFVSSKLGSKLGQQLKDVLSICGQTLPLWMSSLVNGPCKFLFPFEARRRYFYSTAFGLSRALNHMQQLNASESTGGAGGARGGQGHIDRDGRVELRIGRLQRQKVRVSRKRVLDSAIKVMELYSKQKTVLEIEYFGEVGTGLGPTLEFYTLLSHDLQQRSLGLWRHEDNVQATASEGERPAAAGSGEVWHEASEFVNAPYGLFPQPIPPPGSLASFIPNPNAVVAQRARAAEVFKLLGRTLAKALQDCRLMDLPLSYVFYRVALGKPLDILDISRIDPHLGRSLDKMKEALRSYRDALSSPTYSPERPPVLLVDGLRLCDLCLSFTLPGQPSYELCPGGADVEVEDAEGLEKYIAGIVDATLGSGVAAQLDSFREGFNDVFPLETLSCFYEDEIETMLCGSGEKWTVQSLADGIKFDHGYSISNGGGGPVVRSFLEVLSEFDAADQRRFLRFVTGCPRLPPGGIAALQPKLTVVRKPPSGFEAFPSSGGGAVGSPSMGGSFKDTSGMGTTAADGDLPSVMTCANYIKLPPYSTKEVMRQRLTYAIREGQGSFDLS